MKGLRVGKHHAASGWRSPRSMLNLHGINYILFNNITRMIFGLEVSDICRGRCGEVITC